MTGERPEMIEIALRIPQEAVRALLSAAAEALAGTGGRETAAAESGSFQEDVFRRLSRSEEQRPAERKAAVEQAEAAMGDRPEGSTAEDVPTEPPRRRTAERELRGEGPERPSPPEPSLPERRLPEEPFGAEEELPVRRGTGTAGQRLSAPEPVSYAVELPRPAAERASMAEGSSVSGGEAPALTPKALSDRYERDSRRYDGGFTLY